MLWARHFIDMTLLHFHHPPMKRAFLYPHVTGDSPETSETVHTRKVTPRGSADIRTLLFLHPKSAYSPQHPIFLLTFYGHNSQLWDVTVDDISTYDGPVCPSCSLLHWPVNHLRHSEDHDISYTYTNDPLLEHFSEVLGAGNLLWDTRKAGKHLQCPSLHPVFTAGKPAFRLRNLHTLHIMLCPWLAAPCHSHFSSKFIFQKCFPFLPSKAEDIK